MQGEGEGGKVHGGKVAKCIEHSQPFQVGHRPQCQAVTLVLRLHTKDYDIKAGEKVRKKSKTNARQMRWRSVEKIVRNDKLQYFTRDEFSTPRNSY